MDLALGAIAILIFLGALAVFKKDIENDGKVLVVAKALVASLPFVLFFGFLIFAMFHGRTGF